MKCLVSNQTRSLWLCSKLISLLSPSQGYLLYYTFFQEAENLSVSFLKCHVWVVLMWPLASSKIEKNSLEIPSAVQLYSVQPCEGWAVLVKETESNCLSFLYVFYIVSTPVSHLCSYNFPYTTTVSRSEIYHKDQFQHIFFSLIMYCAISHEKKKELFSSRHFSLI